MVKLLGTQSVKHGHKVYVAGLYSPGYGQPDYEDGVKIWRLKYRSNIALFKGSYSFLGKLLLKSYKYIGLLWSRHSCDGQIFIQLYKKYNSAIRYRYNLKYLAGTPFYIASASYFKAQKTKEIFYISKEITVLHSSNNIPLNFKKKCNQ